MSVSATHEATRIDNETGLADHSILVGLCLDPKADSSDRERRGAVFDAVVSHQIPASYRIGYQSDASSASAIATLLVVPESPPEAMSRTHNISPTSQYLHFHRMG